MRLILLFVLFLMIIARNTSAQNVGIGTTSPRGPLSFSGALGQKIILWDDGNPSGNYYGFGIQSGQLQIHSFSSADDIVLGFGSSANFTERMRVKGNGHIGIGVNPVFALDVYDRIRLRSGSVSNTAGIWFNNPTNTATQTFWGVEDANWAGFYGSTGWGLGMNTTNGFVKIPNRLGIGTTTPNAPLGFPPALGKKITLYPGATGDVGFAVQGNLLQIYSDNPNADIAFGYDQTATGMTERFRIRSNGALRINGNAGAPGQVIQSGGDGGTASWGPGTNTLYNNTIEIRNDDNHSVPQSNEFVELAGMTYTFTTTGNAKVYVDFTLAVYAGACAFCGVSRVSIYLQLNGNKAQGYTYDVCNECNNVLSGSKIIAVGPGTHTIRLLAAVFGPQVHFGGGSDYSKIMNVQIIPQ